MKITREILYCVGLWLAEGDSKSTGELTFTNNSLELVLLFQETISKVYSGSNQPRLYVYSATGVKYFENLPPFKKINYYIDSRANRPYYIYRLGDVSFLKIWKELVNSAIEEEKYYVDILIGIFAGEGNIKHQPNHHNSRNIRISAKKEEGKQIIEKILFFLNIPIKYDRSHRAYWISGRTLDKIYTLEICKLHPEKAHKFLKMIESRKEMHYSPGELKKIILNSLYEFKTTKELSKTFGRSEIRISEVLQELKKEGKVDYIKRAGTFFWSQIGIKNKLIKQNKINILTNLSSNYTEIGRKTGIYRKRIPKELEKLKTEGYLYLNSGKYYMTDKGKKLAGIDESGRLME